MTYNPWGESLDRRRLFVDRRQTIRITPEIVRQLRFGQLVDTGSSVLVPTQELMADVRSPSGAAAGLFVALVFGMLGGIVGTILLMRFGGWC